MKRFVFFLAALTICGCEQADGQAGLNDAKVFSNAEEFNQFAINEGWVDKINTFQKVAECAAVSEVLYRDRGTIKPEQENELWNVQQNLILETINRASELSHGYFARMPSDAMGRDSYFGTIKSDPSLMAGLIAAEAMSTPEIERKLGAMDRSDTSGAQALWDEKDCDVYQMMSEGARARFIANVE